jgi:hypothetical protein
MSKSSEINIKPLSEMTNEELRAIMPPRVAIRELLRQEEGDSAADLWYEQQFSD